MTFSELQAEVIKYRFAEGDRPSIKRWINLRYQWISAQADWPWGRIFFVQTLTAGDNHIQLASSPTYGDYRRILRVTNWETSTNIPYMDPGDLFALESVSEGQTGDATAYTSYFSGGHLNVFFDLIASQDTEYRVQGETRPERLESNTEEPLFPEPYHYLLVLGATATGLKMQNDPTWEALETEFLAGVDAMKNELLPPLQPEPRQFGRELEDAWP